MNAAVTPSGSAYASCSSCSGLTRSAPSSSRSPGCSAQADAAQEVERRGRVEVPDVRPEQQDEHRTVAAPRGRGAAQSDLVGGLVTDDRKMLQTGEPLLGLLERL